MWLVEEHVALAQAWINASEDNGSEDVKGTNQDADAFFDKVLENLKTLAPVDTDSIGRHNNREKKALQNHWKDKIGQEIQQGFS